tara:strand:- start:1959 stop:2672 length:714 start_codon:yes stop_codon:yes gene_type:complete
MFNLFSKCIEPTNYKDIEEQKRQVKIDTLPYFTETIDPLIAVYEQALSAELCDEIVKTYIKNKDLQFKGTTLGGVGEIKKTTDVYVSMCSKNNIDFKKIDILLKDNLSAYMEKYVEFTFHKCDNEYLAKSSFVDTGYQIQRYKKNEGLYRTHTDDNSTIIDNVIHSRVITFIWYLNDITEGGETVFINKCKIKPKKGSLLIFPATWTYPHCGMVPKSHDKYIVTGWMYTSLNNIDFR